MTCHCTFIWRWCFIKFYWRTIISMMKWLLKAEPPWAWAGKFLVTVELESVTTTKWIYDHLVQLKSTLLSMQYTAKFLPFECPRLLKTTLLNSYSTILPGIPPAAAYATCWNFKLMILVYYFICGISFLKLDYWFKFSSVFINTFKESLEQKYNWNFPLPFCGRPLPPHNLFI